MLEGVALGGDAAAAELAVATAAVLRPRPPAWAFAAVPYDRWAGLECGLATAGSKV